ncbi:MAG: ATP-binding cassette domain-containing protein [Phototrophicaceae bacterium]
MSTNQALNQPLIEAKRLTKYYGNFAAVRGASFTAYKGEVVGLLGPNGAGKTTLMRMLTGYSPPSSGTAIIAGFDITVDSLDARAKIGYLPERVPLYPDMTVFEYISYWGELRGLNNAKQRRARTDAVIEQVQLSSKRNRLVRSLSKGMRQRLGIAQALVHNPDIIILDEPTIGIDPQQVIEVRQVVRELGKNHAVLFSTHILTEAEQVCDRLLIINQGQIVAEGSPDGLRKQLQHGAQVYVELGGASPAQAKALLTSVVGAEALQPQGEGFVIQTDGLEGRDSLSLAVAQAGFTLRELRPVAMTLEDIFLKIVHLADEIPQEPA